MTGTLAETIDRIPNCFVNCLSTIVDADQILVMQNGDIIEQGSHRELLAVQNSVFPVWLCLDSSLCSQMRDPCIVLPPYFLVYSL